ncbi:MAG: hypothetical protein ACHWZW_21950, partial [Spirulina sp.]
MSVALKSASPTELGQSINSGAITRPPTVGNIDQIAIPQTAQTSNISPTTYVREFNVPGQNVTAEVPYRMPADVGDPLYRPLAGDPLGQPSTRSGRPVRSAGLDGGPINAGSTPPQATGYNPGRGVNSQTAPSSAPRTPNPGRGVNPRVPRVPTLSPGSVIRGGAGLGIGIAGEAAIDAAWDKVAPDREEHYKERTQDPRPQRPSYPEISGGIGAIGAGPIGVAGAAAAAAGRYLFPDDTDPGNPNGVLGRSLGWNDDYPNQTDPDAIPPGPETEPGSSNSGSVSGVVYRAVGGHTNQFGSYVNTVSAPLTGPVSSGSNETYHGNGRQAGKFQVYTDSNGFTV